MNMQELVEHAQTMQIIIEGTAWQLEDTIDALVESENWDLAGRLLVSAAEVPARQLAQKLAAKEAYDALVVGACMRRQPRRPGEGAVGGGVSRRIFRDIDAEDGEKGVPEYIRADIEEMAKVADQTRAGAMMRDSSMDRDPVRQYIVDQLAPRMPHSEAAMNAVVVIARASAWEETRRTAALKVANDPVAVARLARSLRTADIVDIARTALIKAVSAGMAREMGKHFKGYSEAKDLAALRFMAEHHPDEKYRETAGQWVEALEKGAKQGEAP